MPQILDPTAIRGLLETDRRWAVYALGDLDPALFPQCRWFHAPEPPAALVMVYQQFTPAVLFTLGPPDQIEPLLDEIDPTMPMYLHVRPEVVPLLERRYHLSDVTPMWRMPLDPALYSAGDLGDVVRLGYGDLDMLRRLYADGEAVGQGP